MCVLFQLPSNAQKVATLPFDYSNWKTHEEMFSRSDLLRLLPSLSNSLETITVDLLYEDENEHFALTCVRDITYGEGLFLGCLILYENGGTYIYDYDARFATYEYDYKVPMSVINVIYNDMRQNCITRRTIISSIRQFIDHRLALNKWGPGDGYYESPEYSHLVIEDTPLLAEFRREYPFLIGVSIPELISMLGEFARNNGYSIDSRMDVKEMMITLYLLLSPDECLLR